MSEPRVAIDGERQDLPQLWTVSQAAELLNLSAPSVYKLMESGALPYQRFGRCRRVKRSDVLRLIEEATVARA